MSWSLSAVGNKSGVRDAIDREQHIPAVIKDSMKAIVSTFPDNPKRCLLLDTNGHIDVGQTGEYAGGNVMFKLTSVTVTNGDEPPAQG